MSIPSLQAMDSQGLLKPEHGSASVRAQGRQRRSSGGQVIISPDDDSWVKCSPAYLQLQDEWEWQQLHVYMYIVRCLM